MAVTERRSAEERREQILEAALAEFAAHGFEGGSTDAIARAVGISQPYVFRLFGTKKELFIATIERCMSGTLEMFRTAVAGLQGEDALHAIGEAYSERLGTDPTYLRSQMQAYAACDDTCSAAVLLGTAEALRDAAGGPPPAAQRGDTDRAEQRVRSLLTLDVYEGEHTRGRAEAEAIVACLVSG